MTDQSSADEQPQQVFVPVSAQAAPEETPEKDTKADKKKEGDKGEGVPVGQIAAGGVGATILGSYGLAALVGPVGWLAAPAAAVAGGAGYVAYRRRKKRGAKSERRTVKTTTTKGSSSTGRLGSLGGSRAGSPASGGRSGSGAGTRSSSARHGAAPVGSGGGTKGGASARPGSGSARPGGSSGGKGGATPRSSGGPGRGGTAPRSSGGGAKGGASPRPGSSRGRTGGGGSGSPRGGRGGSTGGSDGLTTSSKKKPASPDTPGTNGRSGKPGGGSGKGGTRGGSMPKNRWGKGPADNQNGKKPGRFKRAGSRARDWADDKTGRRASTGWRASRDAKGANAKRKAARAAVKDDGGGGFIAGLVGIIVAIGAAIAGLFKPRKTAEAADGESTQEGAAPGAAGPGPAPTKSTSKEPPGIAHESCRYDPSCPHDKERIPGVVHNTGLYDVNSERTKADVAADAAAKAASTGGNTMSGLPASQIAHDMAGAMSRYEPADAYQIVPDSRQWADVPHQVALSVKAYADRLEGSRFPINQAINDKLQEFAQAMAATRSIAEELEPLMRKAHADDLARQESPRGDESKWNI